MPNSKQALLTTIEYLNNVIKSKESTWNGGRVDDANFWELQAGGQNLARVLGDAGRQWEEVFRAPSQINPNDMYRNYFRIKGTLAAIHQAIQNDLLLEIEKVVLAEAFSDLLGQADQLVENSFFLPAAVLGRAVLEEHLRKMCSSEGCLPSKAKPTLDDFRAALYAKKVITNVEQKRVDAMAAVGNSAAHNLPSFKEEHVEAMLRDVKSFMMAHP